MRLPKSEGGKILAAMAVVLAVSGLSWLLSWKAPAVIFAIISVVVIVYQHFNRCEMCGSWFTTESSSFHADDHNPSHGTTTIRKDCWRCNHSEILRQFCDKPPVWNSIYPKPRD